MFKIKFTDGREWSASGVDEVENCWIFFDVNGVWNNHKVVSKSKIVSIEMSKTGVQA